MVYLTTATPPPPPTATADNNATASEAPPDWMYTRELIAIFGKKCFRFIKSRIHRSCTGVKASFKVGLKLG
jgi:hypothetical protein